jgi:hypothetical protein
MFVHAILIDPGLKGLPPDPLDGEKSWWKAASLPWPPGLFGDGVMARKRSAIVTSRSHCAHRHEAYFWAYQSECADHSLHRRHFVIFH